MKHFAIYSNNKGAREGHARTDPQVSPREVEMIHLWPYERVIREPMPLGVMCFTTTMRHSHRRSH